MPLCGRLHSSGPSGNGSSSPSPPPSPDPPTTASSNGSPHWHSMSRSTPSHSRSPPSSGPSTGRPSSPSPSTPPGSPPPSPARCRNSSTRNPGDSGTATGSRPSMTPRSIAPASTSAGPAPSTNIPLAAPIGPALSGLTTGSASGPCSRTTASPPGFSRSPGGSTSASRNCPSGPRPPATPSCTLPETVSGE
jgi:hypothetical protein